MRKNMRRAGLFAVMLYVMLLSGCQKDSIPPKERHGLQGAWALQKIAPPDDSTHEYHVALYRIYDEDGLMYEYQLLPSDDEDGDVLVSGEMKSYTFIDKGGNDFLYMEGNNLCMMDMKNDSTMVTQQFGMLYTWTHLNTLSDSRMEEIKRIVSQDQNSRTLERHILPQEKTDHTLIYIIMIIIIAIVVAMATSYILVAKVLKRRVKQKMRQLDDERMRQKQQESRKESLQPIGTAELSEADKEFMQSAYYISMQHRLATGGRMMDEEWEEMEVRLNEAYPNFVGTLRGLHKMSETEWQVCMLTKLRVAPMEIAKVMNKDASSISSIRKRLFQKLFDKKGKPKEWDDYILSL